MDTQTTETIPVIVPVTAFPLVRPQIVITELEETPFAVDCLELRYWCIIPRVGESGSWGDYELPAWKLSEAVEARALRPATVHDVEGIEIELRFWKPGEGWQPTGTALARLTEQEAQWLAVSLVHEGKSQAETFLDKNFDWNWGKVGRALEDRGAIERAPDGSLRVRDRAALAAGTGAGLFAVDIEGRSLTCLRVLECDIASEPDALVESFLTPDGRTVLVRRFCRPSFVEKAEFAVLLDETQQYVLDGLTYLHWYDTITSFAL